MNLKLSKWLELSTRLLKARIDGLKENSGQFVEELNLRREAVSEAIEFKSELSIQDIEGAYQIIGANSENAEQGYTGMLTLRLDDNKVYANWLIEGEDMQTGFGMYIDKVLTLHFSYENDGVEYIGVVSYQFLSKNIISGKWVEEASDSVGIEMGRKLPVESVDPLKYFGFN